MVYKIQNIEIVEVKLKETSDRVEFKLSNNKWASLGSCLTPIGEEYSLKEVYEDLQRLIEYRNKHRNRVRKYYNDNKDDINLKKRRGD